MPPYETFTAFWMLSTFLLNWMFANKSHDTGGWHDSPSASLRVILPCNAQGKQICIHSMTNLAVCFHWAGVHIIYFSPPFSFPLSLSVSFSFSPYPSHLCISFESPSMCYLTVIRNIYQFRQKMHFLADLVFSVERRKPRWGAGGVDRDQALNITEGEFTKGQAVKWYILKDTICDPNINK